MRPIPPSMRAKLEVLPRMKRCEVDLLQDVYGECSRRIEWHHVWIYAGQQINEIWAIVGGCTTHHAMASDPAIKALFETASLSYATEANLSKYPRKDWAQIRKSLGLK